MSDYRLTESNVQELNLIEVDWDTVRDHDIIEVFIRAHDNAPTYGPYIVDNADRMIVCTQEGTDPRMYPRDEGLFVRASDLPKTKKKLHGHAEVIEGLMEALDEKISVTESYLVDLKDKQESLAKVLRFLKSNQR